MSFLERGGSPEHQFDGNPQFVDQSVEAPELEKAQKKSELEEALDELHNAEDRLKQSEEDEMIDPQSAQEFFDSKKANYEKLQSEWDAKYGAETAH